MASSHVVELLEPLGTPKDGLTFLFDGARTAATRSRSRAAAQDSLDFTAIDFGDVFAAAPAGCGEEAALPLWRVDESDGASSTDSSGKAPRARAKYTHALSEEDKELLRAEGIAVPAEMSKDTELELRALRRKIKNKRLAHDTRLRKKEEVQTLASRVHVLEAENRSLLQQLMDLRRSLGQPASLLVLTLAFSVAVAGMPVPERAPVLPALAVATSAAPAAAAAPPCTGLVCTLHAVLGRAPSRPAPPDTRLGRARLL